MEVGPFGLLHKPMPFYGKVCADTGGDGKGQERSVPNRTYPDQGGCAECPFALYHFFPFL